MKADIYMKTNQDPFEYAECYKNLVDCFPTIENMIELANAYLNIQVRNESILKIKTKNIFGYCTHCCQNYH